MSTPAGIVAPPLAETLARFAAALRFKALPSEVIRAAELHLADAFGVALAGSSQQFARPVLKVIEESGGHPQSSVWATGERTSASMAALANGTLVHGLDYDDTHTEAIVHASAVIAPTVFAVGEWRGASGKEAIVAAVAGYETMIRIGLAAPGRFHALGFHPTALCGAFGAAVAAGKLLGLDVAKITHALGIVGSQAAGIHEFSVDYGSWMKRFHAGWAAHAGIIAAQMAAGGFTGPATVLEGSWGFFATHVGAEYEPEAVTAGLGEQWETPNLAFKPYPSCHMTHAFVDAARELRSGLDIGSIESVHCHVASGMLPFICEPWQAKLAPNGEYAAKFSLPYCVAAMLVSGELTVASFSDDAISRPDVLALARRIRYEIDADSSYPRGFPGAISIYTARGERLEHRVQSSRGTPGCPFTEEEVREKFAANAAIGGQGERAGELWQSLNALSKRSTVQLLPATI
jgi:2-methylcitrate dehydratase PrpD